MLVKGATGLCDFCPKLIFLTSTCCTATLPNICRWLTPWTHEVLLTPCLLVWSVILFTRNLLYEGKLSGYTSCTTFIDDSVDIVMTGSSICSLMTQICVGKPGHHWLWLWVYASMMSIHYLKQSRCIMNFLWCSCNFQCVMFSVSDCKLCASLETVPLRWMPYS